MEYFLLTQDKRYTNYPILLDLFNKINLRNMLDDNIDAIDDLTVINIKPNKENIFLDLLDNQLLLFSEDMQKIIAKYEKRMIFKMVALIDKDNMQQGNYFIPKINEVDVLHGATEFNLDKSVIKRIVLDKEKLGNNRVFKAKAGTNNYLIVRLDVAESLLRRRFKGLIFKNIEVR